MILMCKALFSPQASAMQVWWCRLNMWDRCAKSKRWYWKSVSWQGEPTDCCTEWLWYRKYKKHKRSNMRRLCSMRPGLACALQLEVLKVMKLRNIDSVYRNLSCHIRSFIHAVGVSWDCCSLSNEFVASYTYWLTIFRVYMLSLTHTVVMAQQGQNCFAGECWFPERSWKWGLGSHWPPWTEAWSFRKAEIDSWLRWRAWRVMQHLR